MMAGNRESTSENIADLKCEGCDCAFTGAYWHDYCADCAAENAKTDPLKATWACLNCNTTFPVGAMYPGRTHPGLECPNCRSSNVSPADGKTMEVPEYFGEVPEVKQ